MRIGFICDLSEGDFKFAADNGFKVVEYNGNYDMEFTKKGKELARYVKKYGVDFNMIGLFGRDFICDDASERARHLADAKKTIDFCAEVGAPVFVTGAGDEGGRTVAENCGRAIEHLGELIEYARPRGIRVALYNCHWTNFAVAPDAWEILMPALPDLGIKFDPSHAVIGGRDYLAEMRDWGHKFYHCHAKGSLTIGGQRFQDPNPGFDETNWGAFFALLYFHNYAGDVNIEQHAGRWLGDLKYSGLLFSKRYLEQYIL
jgi:sugar phosphate isomerase/epimerase